MIMFVMNSAEVREKQKNVDKVKEKEQPLGRG